MVGPRRMLPSGSIPRGLLRDVVEEAVADVVILLGHREYFT